MSMGLEALEQFLMKLSKGTGKVKGMSLEQLLASAGKGAKNYAGGVGRMAKDNPGKAAGLVGGGAGLGALLRGGDEEQEDPYGRY